jgi:hypothetical protein
MKRFWLVLLSLGLVMAFSVSAFAVDVKVSAEYYAAGMYLNKVNLNDTRDVVPVDLGQNRIIVDPGPSTAFFYQRLRVGTDFIVSPCLKLVTRFDAMERIWGGQRSEAGYTGSDPASLITSFGPYSGSNSAGTRAENENIAIDLVYIDYTSPIGLFRVGYQPDYVFGTVAFDNLYGTPAPQIQYLIQKGPFVGFLGYAKEMDNSYSAVNNLSWSSTRSDRDNDSYRIAGIYFFKGGEVGALGLYNRYAANRGRANGAFKSNIYALDPYFKAQIGPVALQGEAQYWFGDAIKGEYGVPGGGTPFGHDLSVSALSVFLDATANFGMFYAGGSFMYLSGDDPSTNDKLEGSAYFYGAGYANLNMGGQDWNPCLILFNNDLNYWQGGISGYSGSQIGQMSNAWFFQGRAGVKPTPQSDVLLSVSYAQADKKPEHFSNGTYGTEIDLTGTYKITNNLTYMLGAGYLFTGDYFKGIDPGNHKVNDDFTVINKLTLSF